MSLHLQISTELNDGSLRLEWVRMPLKSDATSILDYDGFQRLPESSVQESLKDLMELQALRNIKEETAIITSGIE